MASDEKRLNLGCGQEYRQGETNVDFFATRVDVRHDLNLMPYPFNDSTFDAIRCMNIIEHLDDPIAVMHELHRIGKPGALITIRVPHFRSASLYEDITHRRGYAWRTFDLFTDDSAIYGEYSDRRFDMVSRAYTPYVVPILYRMLSRMPTLTDNLLSKYIPMASIMFVMRIRKA